MKKGEIDMRKYFTHPNLMKMVRDIHPRLKFETLHTDHNWNRRQKGGGRYGPEEKACQQDALP